MINKIKQALGTEFKELGLSEKTIGRLADYVKGFVEKEEDIETAVKRDDVKLIAKSIQGEIDGLKKAKESVENELRELKAKAGSGDGGDGGKGGEGEGDGGKGGGENISELIASAVAAAVKPLQESIDTLKNTSSAKEALSSAREKFFGGDYAKKYKDQAEDAWERAVEMNEATGSKMNADELNAKAESYFNKMVARLGVDTSKPFKADAGEGEDEGTTDWSAERARLVAAGKIKSESN